MHAKGGDRGGRYNDLFKGMGRSGRLRSDSSRSPWHTAGWTRGATIIFGHKRGTQGSRPPQSRREIMKEITRKVLADERAAARKGRKTALPQAATTPAQQRLASREQSKERKNPQAAAAPGPEVWAERRKSGKARPAEAKTLIRPRRHSKSAGILALRVVKGLHAGALTPLTSAGVLMIGSKDDCDVILADPGVQSHHCFLTIQDGKVAVRAIDGAVKLGTQEHAPGSVASLELEAAVGLGEAEFEVTAKPEAAKQEAAEPNEAQAKAQSGFAPQRLRGLRGRAWVLGAAAGGFVALGALGITLVLTSRPRTMWVAAPAPASAQAPAVSSPDRILQDVTEVLRLQGIAGELSYTGEGTVTVTGHLGDPRALEQAIESRAMQEIAGLKRVVAVNLDHPGATTGTSADRVRIVSAVSGKDPFVVTADGSRYYSGATLPQGGTLAGVEGDEILIQRNGKTERLKLSDVESGAVGKSSAAKSP